MLPLLPWRGSAPPNHPARPWYGLDRRDLTLGAASILLTCDARRAQKRASGFILTVAHGTRSRFPKAFRPLVGRGPGRGNALSPATLAPVIAPVGQNLPAHPNRLCGKSSPRCPRNVVAA